MTEERWRIIPKREQLLAIGAEFERARVWERKGEVQFKGALERALTLIDLTIADSKWKAERLQLFVLRDLVAGHYVGTAQGSIRKAYEVL